MLGVSTYTVVKRYMTYSKFYLLSVLIYTYGKKYKLSILSDYSVSSNVIRCNRNLHTALAGAPVQSPHNHIMNTKNNVFTLHLPFFFSHFIFHIIMYSTLAIGHKCTTYQEMLQVYQSIIQTFMSVFFYNNRG